MVTKSVIEIDVVDEKFKAFAAAFDKYQKALKSMPADWQKVNAESGKGAVNINKELQKATKSQKDLNKEIKDSNVSFSNVARTTGQIALNLASSAVSIAKWVSFGALGGGFGLAGISARTSEIRKTAQGLGVTTGELRSANVNLGRYLNPETTLANIADVKSDLSQRQILTRLGGKEGENPAEMLPQLIKSAVSQFKFGGQTKQYAEAMGLTQVFTLEELRRLSSLTEKELNQTINDFKKDRELLKLDDETSRAWQDFWIQLKRSTNVLEVSFIGALKDLVPQFTELSKSITVTISDFLKSDDVKKSLSEFADYLKTPEFKENIALFFEGLKDLAKAIGWVVGKVPAAKEGLQIAGEKVRQWVGRWNDPSNAANFGLTPTQQKIQDRQDAISFGKVDTSGSAEFQNRASQVAGALMKLGVKNPNAIAGFLGGLRGESREFNPKDVNPTSGAYGIAQWLGSRQKDLESFTGKSYKDTSFEEQVKFMMYELTHKEAKTLEALKTATTKEEGVKANIGYERYDTYMDEAQKKREIERRMEFARGINIDVNVSSTAGSDITASAKGLPQ